MKKVKKKQLKLSINLNVTNEIFKLNQIYPETLIRDLRSESEIATGIPTNIQQVYYLDKCDLMDDTTVQNNDFVSYAVLTMDVWHVWKDLVVAAAKNEITKIFSMGVTQDSEFSTPSKPLWEKEKRQWLQERANMVLLIAAHRGHLELCTELIKRGANVNCTTKLGRTPLHLAAAQDKSNVIDLLLHKGADIDIMDSSGLSPMELANKYGHKSCERHLFMFRWQQRAKNMESKFLNPPMMAFQMFDSSLPKWKTGPAAQFYCQKLLPPGEFLGSAFNSPKRNWHRRCSASDLSNKNLEIRDEEKVKEEKEKELAKATKFNQWLKQKSIQKKINDDIARKKEDSQRMIEQEKRRQKIAKWKEINGIDDMNNGQDYEHLKTSYKPGERLIPTVDTKTKIKDLLLKYGLAGTEETPRTVYEHWLQQRNRMGKAVIDDNLSIYGGYLPYQQMIREFCSKKCH